MYFSMRNRVLVVEIDMVLYRCISCMLVSGKDDMMYIGMIVW